MTDSHTQRFLPQVGPWEQFVNITVKGDLYATWHLSGFAAELAGAGQIRGLRAGLNQLAVNIGRPNVEWWTHLTRRKLPKMTNLPPCAGWFAQRFDAAYQECMAGDLYSNDVWFSVLLQAPTGLQTGLKGVSASARNLTGRKADVPCPEAMFLQKFDDLAAKVHRGLSIYGPTRPGLVEGQNGTWRSQIDEACHVILNNEHRQIPVLLGRCGRNIDPYEVEYGDRDWCVHTGSQTQKLGTLYSWMSYPALDTPVMFDSLLSAPFAFTMTNSAHFVSSSEVLEWLAVHTKKMVSGNNAAKSQQVQLVKAQDNLQSRDNVWDHHHFSPAVFSDEGIRDLDVRAVEAETLLANAGINPVREDRALKAGRFAQLPANTQAHSTVSLVPAIDGDIQVVTSSGFTLVDVQAARRSVTGDLVNEHAFVRLSYSNVLRLRDLLDQIAGSVEPRQQSLSAIWSDSTNTLPVPAGTRRRRAA